VILVIGLLLVAVGGLMWLIAKRSPQRRVSSALMQLDQALIEGAPDLKYKIDLPSGTGLLWKASIEPDKTPFILDEKNIIILRIWPWFGARGEAAIEVPVATTDDLKDVKIKSISSALEIAAASESSYPDVTGPVELRYIATPRTAGETALRFEFWFHGSLCGVIERPFLIRSRQYGVTLSAGFVRFLKVGGLGTSGTGAVLSILKLLRLL